MAWMLVEDDWGELLELAYRSSRTLLRDHERSFDAAVQTIERLLVKERRGEPEPLDLRGYAFVVAKNLARDVLRAEQRHSELPASALVGRDGRPAGVAGRARRDRGAAQDRLFDPFESSELEDFTDAFLAGLISTELLREMRALLPEEWWPVWARHLEGHPAPAIASMMGPPCSPGSVRTTICRARLLLRAALPGDWSRVA